MCSSTSSSVLSVWSVGEVRIEAAEEMGSKEATLERMEGMETRERVRKGQRGGSSGVSVVAVVVVGGKSRLGRGVATPSVLSIGMGGVVAAVAGGFGLASGDLFSEPLRSLPLPRTAFRKEPLRFRGALVWRASDMALRPAWRAARSSFSLSLFSPSLGRKMFSLASRFPEIDLLWEVAGFFFSLDLGVSS